MENYISYIIGYYQFIRSARLANEFHINLIFQVLTLFEM